jgi:hypothetical protein
MELRAGMDSTAGRRKEPMSSPTPKRKHPHFDDRGALDWHTTFAEASAEAQRDGKKLFIELGREL